MPDFNDLANGPEAAENAANAFDKIKDSALGASGGIGTLLAMLNDVTGTLSTIAQNPLAAPAYMMRHGNLLRDRINAELKNTHKYTEAEAIALAKISAQIPNLTKIAGGFTAISLAAASAYQQTVKASNELTRYTSIAALPGGANTVFGAQQHLLRKSAGYAFDFSQEFSQIREQQYLNILPYFSKDIPEIAIEQLSKQFTVLSRGIGVDLSQQFGSIMEKYGEQLDPTQVAQFLIRSAGLSREGAFGKGAPPKVLENLLRSVYGVEQGTQMDAARAMQVGSSLFGGMKSFGFSNEFSAQLISGIANASGKWQNRIFGQAFGLDAKNIVQSPERLPEFLIGMRNFIGNARSRTELAPAKQGQLDQILNALGISEESFWKVSKAKDLPKTLDEAVRKLTKFNAEISNISGSLPQRLKRTEEEQAKETTLGDWVFSATQKLSAVSNDISKQTGLDPVAIQLLGLAGGGLAFRAGIRRAYPILKRAATRMMTPGANLGAAQVIDIADDAGRATQNMEQAAARFGRTAGETPGRTAANLTKSKGLDLRSFPKSSLLYMVDPAVTAYENISQKRDALTSIKEMTKAGVSTITAAAAGFLGGPTTALAVGAATRAAFEQLDVLTGGKTYTSAESDEYMKKYSNIDPTAKALLRGNKIDSSITTKFLEKQGRAVSDNTKVANISSLASPSLSSSNKDVGTLRVVFTNEKGVSLGQTDVALNTENTKEQVIRLYLGGAISNFG